MSLTRLLAENTTSLLTFPSGFLPNTAAVIISAECLWNCSNGMEATFPLTLLAIKIKIIQMEKLISFIMNTNEHKAHKRLAYSQTNYYYSLIIRENHKDLKCLFKTLWQTAVLTLWSKLQSWMSMLMLKNVIVKHEKSHKCH